LVLPTTLGEQEKASLKDVFGKLADYPLAKVAKLWADFAEWLLPYPHVFGADIKNEPCEQSMQGKRTDWAGWVNAVETCGAAILAKNPHLYIVVEGNDENLANTSPAPCWGASLSGLKTKPIDPAKIPVDRIIYSPHQYGAGVVGADSTSTAWEANWGFLKKGAKKECVNMGEWSLSLKSADLDADFNMRLAKYMADNEIDSFFFAINNTSSDTLGLIGKANSAYEPMVYHKGDYVVKAPTDMVKPEPDPTVPKPTMLTFPAA
jgi:endoglucanase